MTLADDLHDTAAALRSGWPITNLNRARRVRAAIKDTKMGTRGLTAVVIDGEVKIAQYGQWDHYPSGQGTTVLAFCRDVMLADAKRERFITNLRRCRFATAEDQAEMDEWFASVGIVDGWMNGIQANAFKKRYPLLSRDNGAHILELVADINGDAPIVLQDSWSFGADSLFCEWAYVLDVTNGTVEVYRGFNKDGTAVGRFAALPTEKDNEYAPVTLIKTYRIAELPTDAQFVDELEGADQ